MKLIISKPAIGAFEGDLKSSAEALNAVREQVGAPKSGAWFVNKNLSFDTGLQVIVREKDLADLSRLERNLAQLGDMPFAIHAPYNYGQPSEWHVADLSNGKEGLANLLKVVRFGDNIQASSIAVHPNSIREKARLEEPSYTHEARIRYLDNVFANIFEARAKARVVSVDLENKPFPATTADNENIMYGITFAPFEDIRRFTNRGGRITFDTCHFGITMRTINDAIEAFEYEVSDDKLRENGILGYFAKDFVEQPAISRAMVELGDAINHIHLNDGSPYRPDNATGKQDVLRTLPKIGGVQLWWEAYVPGNGRLCQNRVLYHWIANNQQDKRDLPLTVEVTEFDGNYKESPRFREAAISLARDVQHFFRD